MSRLDEAAAAESDAQSLHRRLDRHEALIEHHAAPCRDRRGQAGGGQPKLPVLARNRGVQQRVVREVLGRAQRLGVAQQCRTAHREDMLGHQPVGAQAGPGAAAIADGDVHLLALEIDQVRGGRDAHLDARIGVLERGHPRHQPLGGQRGRGADGQPPVVIGAAQSRGGAVQVLERGADGRQIVLRLPRQFQRAVAADEQGDAELLLQPADLMADRGLGDVQFGGRAREAQVASGGLERAQAVERGQGSGMAAILP